ncbi:uncharacterized protein LOC133204662 [Saccostrea echinata]|uniref:uncharacterized protein LOC133204662 n=1 Tax=Saccostrea echinata TaxID=191078 RepID=UPI002A82CF86|nr:uncharacterized protein LOC133204662 [Saccostrea echinata]
MDGRRSGGRGRGNQRRGGGGRKNNKEIIYERQRDTRNPPSQRVSRDTPPPPPPSNHVKSKEQPSEMLHKKSERLLTEPGPTYNLIVYHPFKEENTFLEHLKMKELPSHIEFNIESFTTNPNGLSASVWVHFPSNNAYRQFQLWMRQTKNLGFLYRFQREEVAKVSKEFIDKNLQNVQERSDHIIGMHHDKIRETKQELSDFLATKKTKKKTKYVSLPEFERREMQTKTLENKVAELEKQLVEFERSVEDIKRHLIEFEGSTVKQDYIDQLLREFEIEYSRLEQALPIYAKRSEIVNSVLKNQVCILLGETGSGKSTQLTQYLLQSKLPSNGHIVCTQPRKVAAASLAQRVASEMKSTVADIVGYQCGIQKKVSDQTKVVYMTDHTLLNECIKDPLLNDYSCIIIDEAHERSIYTDLLLGMIKKCLPRRQDIRIIVTSATIDPELFVRYFEGCPVIEVPGRMYPVDVEWETNSGDDDLEEYERKAVEKTLEIHDKEPPGDILLFLTGQLEIEKCIERLQWELEGRTDHWILPLHGKLQTEEQNKIFKETPHGKRKIVISTNVAETSVTIPGVKYVIDTGLAKEMKYDPDKKVNSLRVVKITKSSADQRKGRAGRTAPGKCYRFYSKEVYDNMTASSIPEILRIHIGHAILKLLQLNVNPLAFEFVEAPPDNSMETAFQQLVNIAAVENGKIPKITELGLWIAQLPLEPNLGVFVHNAIKMKVGLDAIIIAASCTVSGNLFYRAGTKEQKNKCDKLKIPFCHSKGDHFTFLSVFKKWHYVPEKEKSQWCLDNSINGRAMRNIRDTVNEIRFLLKNQMNMPLKFELKDVGRNERTLQKLMFKAFRSNLCYFLGHEKAGYYFIDKDQQMTVHPSASFQSLASYPKWVIIEKVLNTSREFAVNITEVNEDDVQEALKRNEINFDLTGIERKRIEPIYTEYIGSQVHYKFVGPKWKHAKDLETKLKKENTDSIFVIDADRDKGEVSIYAPGDKDEESIEALKNALDPIRENIRKERIIFPIFPRCYNVKVSIGPGGMIKDVLCEDDYNNVYVYCSEEEFDSDEELVEWMRQFGEIQKFQTKSPANTNPRYRGEVVFNNSESAKQAVAAARDKTLKIQIKPPVWKTDDSNGFKAKITWCRRKPKGFGFVQIKNSETLETVLTLSSMTQVSVGGSNVRISRSRGNVDELHVQGINPLVNEDILREGISEGFNVPENEIGKTFVPRQEVKTTREILDTHRRRIERHIAQFVNSDKFKVHIREPYQKDYDFNGVVTFTDPEQGNEVCANLQSRNTLNINDSVVIVIPEIHTRLYVLERVFKRVNKDIKDFCAKAKKDGVFIDIKQNTTGNYILNIEAESVDNMIKTRDTIQNLLQGQILSMEGNPSLRSMFTRDGRSKVDKIMAKTHTLVMLNDRNTTISVHGKEADRALAIRKIQKYLEKLSSFKLRRVDLKGETKPPGLMKRIIQMHGIDLQGLKDVSDLSSVELDHRRHRIEMLGSVEAIQSAVNDIEELTKMLLKDNQHQIPSTDPECGICLCSISDCDLYRLESCGHAYCRDCVRLHLNSALSTKEFPLRCCYEGCDMLWAWSDINNMKKFGFCTIQTLIDASVSCYVAQNKDKARYCITPDCQMVYKVSQGGGRFVCSLCHTALCSKCHIEYHTGKSCAVFEREKQLKENGLAEWMSGDTLNRDLCPKCYIGIERYGGCQHMICSQCKCHICWLCKAYFDSSADCYRHMFQSHNTFV